MTRKIKICAALLFIFSTSVFAQAEKKKQFTMWATEISALDQYAATIPDTFDISGSVMPVPKILVSYCKIALYIKDLKGEPLVGERVTLRGEKRNKCVRGITGSNGEIILYLLKDDSYWVDFIYDSYYSKCDIDYSIGMLQAEISLSYMGTKEAERRKKEEEERIKAEESRLKEELARFKAECKRLKITEEEGRRREIVTSVSSPDTVISATFRRNKWSEKLIVCDVTGSMLPYTSQLSVWFQFAYTTEKNPQFVFFNDGDNKIDSQKKVGDTGGIYYTAGKSVDELIVTMGKAAAMGDGGDCAENNMEALIKGVKLAAPFKEIVMIVDNYAPVKDITLLNEFKQSVHIILCGATSGRILEDYLNIARKTNGSIHTIEEDIFSLASASEGQEIKINDITYRVMGGKFVNVGRM